MHALFGQWRFLPVYSYKIPLLPFPQGSSSSSILLHSNNTFAEHLCLPLKPTLVPERHNHHHHQATKCSQSNPSSSLFPSSPPPPPSHLLSMPGQTPASSVLPPPTTATSRPRVPTRSGRSCSVDGELHLTLDYHICCHESRFTDSANQPTWFPREGLRRRYQQAVAPQRPLP